MYSGQWPLYHNRDERITSDGRGVRCEWRFTSDLHIAKVFPRLGAHLMRAAFEEWPVVLQDAPHPAFGHPLPASRGEGSRRRDPSPRVSGEKVREARMRGVEDPTISFIIGHRGLERLPNLLLTLRSIAGQSDVSIECIVVEQSAAPEIKEKMPPWVRYVFTESHDDYNRSATLNAGTAAARGEVVILHDNDMVVPARYAAEVLERVHEGARFIDLKRFIFYLDEAGTERAFATGKVDHAAPVATVVQNPNGGSIAATREAYFDIGGFDEG